MDGEDLVGASALRLQIRPLFPTAILQSAGNFSIYDLTIRIRYQSEIARMAIACVPRCLIDGRSDLGRIELNRQGERLDIFTKATKKPQQDWLISSLLFPVFAEFETELSGAERNKERTSPIQAYRQSPHMNSFLVTAGRRQPSIHGEISQQI